MEVEEFIRVDVFFQVSIGIERKDRWELAGLHAWKGVTEPYGLRIWGEPGC